MSVFSQTRRMWKQAPVPTPIRRSLAAPMYKASVEIGRLRRRLRLSLAVRPGPLIVSGFFDEIIGIGRGGSATVRALERSGLPVVRHELSQVVASAPFETLRLPAGPGGVWIQHCNPPENEVVFSHFRPREIQDRYRIGYWAWELADIPRSWRATAQAFHEIWAPSEFVADAIRPYARQVHVMPHPLTRPTPVASDRARFGLPATAVVFAAFADARSALVRKNPLGAVQAYLKAFPSISGATFLSIKIVQPDADLAGMDALRQAAAGRLDIRIWSERLSEEDMAVYLASIDVVVSLHRSEGFGLVLAEAYLSGKAVIATEWSGNVDLIEPEARGDSVAAHPVRVDDPSGRYRNAVWAEPDIEAASALMQRMAADPKRRTYPAALSERLERRLHQPWTRAEFVHQSWRPLVAPDKLAA